jgi:hypothetical protein
MLNKTIKNQISKISNTADMNELIRLVKAQRAIVQASEAAKAKAKFFSKRDGWLSGSITKMKIKRANVMTELGQWDVPLTLLEVA